MIECSSWMQSMPNQKFFFSPSWRLGLKEAFFFFFPLSRISRRGITFEASPPFQKGQIWFSPFLAEEGEAEPEKAIPDSQDCLVLSACSTTIHSEEVLWDESTVCVFHLHSVNLLSDPSLLRLFLAQKHACADIGAHCGNVHTHSEHQSRGVPLLLRCVSASVVGSSPSGHLLTFQWELLNGWCQQRFTCAVTACFLGNSWSVRCGWGGCWKKQNGTRWEVRKPGLCSLCGIWVLGQSKNERK